MDNPRVILQLRFVKIRNLQESLGQIGLGPTKENKKLTFDTSRMTIKKNLL